MNSQKVLTVSNFLSFIRIFFIFPIVHYLSMPDNSGNTTALIYIVIAIITDWLDGYAARKLNQVTELGKVLDPLADKLCTITTLITLSVYQDFPWWLTIVIIIRDILIVFGSIFIFSRKQSVTASNMPGKITIFLISVLVLVFILKIEYLITPLIILSLIMIIYSAVSYALVFKSNYIIQQ